tara:strand:- start:341 stop:505 length:165 start_codon:yes stop_codon:yes gene_type:complete
MFTALAITALIFVCIKLNSISNDIKFIRISLEEIESAVDNNTWVVYDNNQHAQQ